MTEVLNSRNDERLSESLILDDHMLYDRYSNMPIPVSLIHRHIMASDPFPTRWMPRIEDVDEAYATHRLEHAGWILDQLTKHEPYYYSSNQNRIALNKLAHPMQQCIALRQQGEAFSAELMKDVEAVYGSGIGQLEFLLEQLYSVSSTAEGVRANIEGSLSELTIFLLATRGLTGESSDPYLIVPSTYAQDHARVHQDGMRQGYDFTVHKNNGVQIPLQVKTSTTQANGSYPDHILVVSVAQLIDHTTTSPQALAEAIYFEISNAQTYDKLLIDTAEARLTVAFDNYRPPAK